MWAGPRSICAFPSIKTTLLLTPTHNSTTDIGVPLMDPDGSNVRRLILEGGHCDSPDWSPDGRFILYLSEGRVWLRFGCCGGSRNRPAETKSEDQEPNGAFHLRNHKRDLLTF